MNWRHWFATKSKAREGGLFLFGCLGIMLVATLALTSIDASESLDVAGSTALSTVLASAVVMLLAA